MPSYLAVSPVREPFLTEAREGRYTREDYAADLGDVIVTGKSVRNAPSDIVDFEGTALQLPGVTFKATLTRIAD